MLASLASQPTPAVFFTFSFSLLKASAALAAASAKNWLELFDILHPTNLTLSLSLSWILRVSFLQPDHAARHWTLHNIHIAHFLCPYHPSSSRLRVPKHQFSCNCSYYYSQFTYRRVQDKWERISAMKSQVVVRTAPRRPCNVAKLLPGPGPGSANCANSPAWAAPAAPAAQILQAGLAPAAGPVCPVCPGARKLCNDFALQIRVSRRAAALTAALTAACNNDWQNLEDEPVPENLLT